MLPGVTDTAMRILIVEDDPFSPMPRRSTLAIVKTAPSQTGAEPAFAQLPEEDWGCDRIQPKTARRYTSSCKIGGPAALNRP